MCQRVLCVNVAFTDVDLAGGTTQLRAEHQAKTRVIFIQLDISSTADRQNLQQQR